MTPDHRQQEVIQSWMLSAVRDGGLGRYDDLHVDQIDKNWRPRELWISAACEVLPLAAQLLRRNSVDATLAIVFSLLSTLDRQGVDFTTSLELLSRLDWSPPSLYLFKKGDEPWLRNDEPESLLQETVVHDVDMSAILPLGVQTTGRVLEFRLPNEREYYRTIFVSVNIETGTDD